MATPTIATIDELMGDRDYQPFFVVLHCSNCGTTTNPHYYHEHKHKLSALPCWSCGEHGLYAYKPMNPKDTPMATARELLTVQLATQEKQLASITKQIGLREIEIKDLTAEQLDARTSIDELKRLLSILEKDGKTPTP